MTTPDAGLNQATLRSRALALLHELQVHQVEVDLQSEELRRSLDGFLTPDGMRALHVLIETAGTGAPRIADLTLRGANGEIPRRHASVRSDPTADRVLIALMEAAEPPPASSP